MDIVREEMAGASAVVHLKGRLDLISGTEVRQHLADAIAAGRRNLVVDLAEVPFIDSSGLAALISGLKSTRTVGGDLRIARPAAQAKVILELTRLDRVLRCYETIEEALTGFER
jgi:anti-sigma B factor antagonist